MKKLKYIFYSATLLFLSVSCEQELVDNSASPCPSDDPSIICPQDPDPACPADASAGNADFSKFVAMGSSYTAGFQAGALFDAGQDHSLASILATQFACVGGGAFNQPDIGSENGFNIFVTPNPIIDGTSITTLGRFKLQGTPPQPSPVLAGNEAIPNPALNPSFLYAGDKAALNNFAVQATFLAQIFTPAAGDWTNPNPAVGFSPFYARFASDPGNSTIIGDAAAAAPTFLMFWVGMDDYLLHAALGGDATKAPLTPVEGGVGVGFTATYNAAIATIFGPNPDLKGVIANFPSVFALPHFTAVTWNAIPLDAATASALTSNLAVNYNAFLDGMVANMVIDADEAALRKLTFAEGQNAILINDETLTDLTDYMQGPYAGLQPYAIARQTKSTDIIPLSAGAVLGEEIAPGQVRGVSVPLGDQYALIPSEVVAIELARTGYNAAIAEVAANYSGQLALADVNAAFNTFLTNRAAVSNNITITPNINPPTGIYSEDGMHPNSRGYAFIANIFIDAINTKFGANVPRANLANYSATGLPINPD